MAIHFCTICGVHESVINWHHTVPRSRGGDNSKQIPLCASCHDILHANAVAVVAKIRGSKKPLREFWSAAESRNNAQKWLEILVRSLLTPPLDTERKHLVSCSVSTKVFEELKLLQADQGFSSQEKTLEFCVNSTIQSKGLRDVRNKKEYDEPSAMWIMHVQRTRKDI